MVSVRISLLLVSFLGILLAAESALAQQTDEEALSEQETSENSDETAAEPESSDSDEATEDTAQEEDDGETGQTTWRPRGGSIIPGSARAQQRTTGMGLTDHPVRPEEELEEDDRPELLVFDLYFDDGVRFSQRYRTRLEEAVIETIDDAEGYRTLTSRERSRRLTEAARLVADEVSDDYADATAADIEVDYYLIPRIEVENRRTYRITITIGRAGEGELGRTLYEGTSNRVVDNVERQLERLTQRALARESE